MGMVQLRIRVPPEGSEDSPKEHSSVTKYKAATGQKEKQRSIAKRDPQEVYMHSTPHTHTNSDLTQDTRFRDGR